MPDTPDSYEGPTRDGRKRFSNPTSVREFIHGQHAVTTSGTTMSEAELASGVRIKANGGIIAVGGANVTTENGYVLDQNEEVFIDIDSMKKVYVVAASTGFTAEFIAS
jgi:dTDP-4-amino-4,6-dideoxygalactose transaminase